MWRLVVERLRRGILVLVFLSITYSRVEHESLMMSSLPVLRNISIVIGVTTTGLATGLTVRAEPESLKSYCRFAGSHQYILTMLPGHGYFILM